MVNDCAKLRYFLLGQSLNLPRTFTTTYSSNVFYREVTLFLIKNIVNQNCIVVLFYEMLEFEKCLETVTKAHVR